MKKEECLPLESNTSFKLLMSQIRLADNSSALTFLEMEKKSHAVLRYDLQAPTRG